MDRDEELQFLNLLLVNETKVRLLCFDFMITQYKMVAKLSLFTSIISGFCLLLDFYTETSSGQLRVTPSLNGSK